MSFDTFILGLGFAGLLYSVTAVIVGIWALVTHREKIYRARKASFDAQFERVSSRLDKTRKERG